MKILYDHQIFSSQVFGGISRYFVELFKQFDASKQVEYAMQVKWSNNFYLQKSKNFTPRHFFDDLNFCGKNRLLEYINRYNTVRALRRSEYDLFHPTFYNPYFLKYLKSKPFVLTVHDLIHEIYPQLPNADKEVYARKLLINNAAMIITPSLNTKKDLLNFYAVDEDKIKVIYHGFFKITNQCKPKIDRHFPPKYFLFVGSRVFYKNFSLVVEAMDHIRAKYPNIHLICAGGGKFSEEENNLIANLNLSAKISQYNFSDDELMVAYQRAVAFVFPSLYEGFGIPILEAFSNNCPCLLAEASCFHEVAQDAAYYFDPKKSRELSVKMLEMLSDKNKRGNLIASGQSRLKYFDWGKTAKETIDVYSQVLAQN